jgi:DNA-binding NarL/FixJ family response regulator
MDKIRVLVADDHALFRDGLKALLNSLPDMDVVGEASTGTEAVAQAAALEPDVVVLDIAMPEMGGIEAMQKILRAQPLMGIVAVTMANDDDTVFYALRAGARGYVQKNAGQEELLPVIRAVASGQSLFGPAIARRLTAYFADSAPSTLFPELTERERQILGLLAQGLDNTEIVRRLGLRPKTVSNAISSILNKLQVSDRTQAILRARELGLGARP